jgi:citrate lyase subunit gamma (acyl carrier protein)
LPGIQNDASAGSEEKGDVNVFVGPGDDIVIEVECAPLARSRVESAARAVIEEHGVASGSIRIVDKGALDPVIRARTRTALRRGGIEC